MSWGGLNKALTAWRSAIEKRFPGRGRASDGGYADAAHGSTSQHQADGDGTVDAFDMDVNVLNSGEPTGSATERRLIEAMKLDFERDPRGRSLLWISYRRIANRMIGNFRERGYDGASAHDHHVHWESRQDHEDDGSEWPMPNTDALLRAMRGDDVTEAEMEQVAELAANKTIEKLTKILATAETSEQTDDHSIVRNLRRIPWGYSGMLERLTRLDDGVKELLERVPDDTPMQGPGK